MRKAIMFQVILSLINLTIIVETQYDQAQLDKIDMQSLNLFGVPLDESIGND